MNRFDRASLLTPTVAVFAVFAAVLWLNVAVYGYLFNVALAVLGSIPLLFLLGRSAVLARSGSKTAGVTPAS